MPPPACVGGACFRRSFRACVKTLVRLSVGGSRPSAMFALGFGRVWRWCLASCVCVRRPNKQCAHARVAWGWGGVCLLVCRHICLQIEPCIPWYALVPSQACSSSRCVWRAMRWHVSGGVGDAAWWAPLTWQITMSRYPRSLAARSAFVASTAQSGQCLVARSSGRRRRSCRRGVLAASTWRCRRQRNAVASVLRARTRRISSDGCDSELEWAPAEVQEGGVGEEAVAAEHEHRQVGEMHPVPSGSEGQIVATP